MAVHEERIGQDALGGAVGLKSAGVDDQNAGAEIEDKIQIVRGDELQAGEMAEDPLQLSPGAGVERCRRLVENENGGFAGQKPRQADPFAFADAELGRIARAGVRQADRGQGLGYAAADFIEAVAGVERTEGDIVLDGGAEELVVGVLKQQSDLAADQRKLCGDDGDARHVDGGFRRAFGQDGRQQAVEVEQQRRFTGAAGSDECDAFAVAETERHPVQSELAGGIAVGQLPNFQSAGCRLSAGLSVLLTQCRAKPPGKGFSRAAADLTTRSLCRRSHPCLADS